jgi:hypothetical protein
MLHRKQKMEQHELTKNESELRCSGRVGSFCYACATRRFILV